MRNIVMLLVVAGVSVSLPALADEPEAPSAPSSGAGAAVAPSTAHGLGRIHGGLTADSARVAGRSRDITMSATKVAAAGNAERPAPTPRALRRMSSERVVASIDANARACASESATVAPTTFGLRVSVGPGGEVESAALSSTTRVSPAMLACVTKVVLAARFGSPGAAGASIVVPVSVPGRPAPASGPAAAASAASAAPAAPNDATAEPTVTAQR